MLASILSIISNYFDAPENDKVHREWLNVVEWLAPPKAAVELQALIHKDARNNHEPGTGHWFIDGASFKSGFLAHQLFDGFKGVVSDTCELSREAMLTLLFPVCCGKTILFSMAVEKTRETCRSTKSNKFAYFYCTSRDPSGQDITILLRLLLVQLCRPSTVPAAIQELYYTCNEIYPPKVPTFGN